MEKKYPEPAAGAVIINNEGKILLTRTYKWKDKFTIPGGHIEIGETIEEALKREVKEEVGIDIEIVRILLVHDAIFSKNFHEPKHFIFLDYLCKAKTTKVKIDNKEIQEFEWVEPKKALDPKRVDFFAIRAIKKYLEIK